MATYEWDKCPYCGEEISDMRIGVASDTTIGQPLGGCPRIKKLDRTDQPTNLQKKDVGFLFWIIVNIS